MSIVIPDMKMPKSCAMCKLRKGPRIDMTCFDHSTLEKEYLKSRPEWCPLIELPPHGRLGDLDELHKEAVRRSEKAGVCNNWYNCTNRVISAFDIENAPTIIPAEGVLTDEL